MVLDKTILSWDITNEPAVYTTYNAPKTTMKGYVPLLDLLVLVLLLTSSFPLFSFLHAILCLSFLSLLHTVMDILYQMLRYPLMGRVSCHPLGVCSNQKSKIKNQKSKIKNQKSKIKNQKSKIKNQKSKIKNQESRIKNQKSEVKSQKSNIKS